MEQIKFDNFMKDTSLKGKRCLLSEIINFTSDEALKHMETNNVDVVICDFEDEVYNGKLYSKYNIKNHFEGIKEYFLNPKSSFSNIIRTLQKAENEKSLKMFITK